MAVLCGLHLPAGSVMFGYVFTNFATNAYDDVFMHNLVIAFIMYACVGLAVMLTQFGSVSYLVLLMF